MDEIRKNIRHVFWLYFALFAALGLYLGKFLLFDSADIATSSLNPRLMVEKDTVLRGDILDSSGTPLAYTNQNTKTRMYPYGEITAHIVGYADYGRAGFAGIEAKSNYQLQNASSEMLQRIKSFFSGEPVKGNSSVLTIDSKLQEYVYSQLAGHKGAAIVMEPSTGKILAMASWPAFNPATIKDDWSTLRQDEENSPLLNRATQGKYPPGSVFKIVTAAAAIEYVPDAMEILYECGGEEAFSTKRIRCYNSTAHGLVNMNRAFALSCNTYFSTLSLKITPGNLRSTADRLLFNTAPPFELESGISTFTLSSASLENETLDTSIGQGKTMATPLQIALITSAVANGGIMMEPYILDHYKTYNGSIFDKRMPAMLAQAFTLPESIALSEMMKEVVDYGTGNAAAVRGYDIAAKTGSAENPSGEDHGWFTAFGPYENPQFALVVIGENSGGSGNILQMSKNIMSFILKNS
ncbi:MAG: penicillin-binding protein 2 [Clostridiales bacterium]|jgi:peptidoglycan glycosyltransferase|nr:penicillin-binding protein 2 [Clostridiales bacterium]